MTEIDDKRVEAAARVLCSRDDSMYHHERTDDHPCSACLATARAALEAADAEACGHPNHGAEDHDCRPFVSDAVTTTPETVDEDEREGLIRTIREADERNAFPVGSHDLADALLAAGYRRHDPNEVQREKAEVWDQGYETGRDDELYDQRGLATDPDYPHKNPYREAGQ